MPTYTRRHTLGLLSSAGLGLALSPTSFALSAEDTPDWSQAIVDSEMARVPEPARLGGWGYAVALFLYGAFLLYKRTGDKKLLVYVQGWVDAHVSADGTIDRSITALDYILPGRLLLALHAETHDPRYRKAAEAIRRSLDHYPRTEDGGLWHAYSRQHQLWLDGMYMSMPFLVRYGLDFHEGEDALDEAAKQLLVYARHLNDPGSGLMFHAYDESGAQKWAAADSHHSGVFWCRSIGWFGMALIEVLELMPTTHKQRGDLIALIRQLATAYERYQDPATGLWFQVVDQAKDPRNWLETSSSCMFTYTLAKAVARKYIPKSATKSVARGYRGVLSQLSLDADGHAHIANICEGTNVGDLQYYFDRPRRRDDFHGLGAFLIMNEELRGHRL